MNVAALRRELSMDNLSRNLGPKFMTIKTAASLIERNRPAFVEIEMAGKSFPGKQILFPEKSKINPIFHLPKSAKKLDGEESRTILLNGKLSHPISCQTLEKSSYIPVLMRRFGSNAQVWTKLLFLRMA